MNRIALLLSLSVLSSCAWLPEDGKRAELMAMSVSQTLNSDAGKIIHAWPKAHWWTDFHNAELNRLIETALQDSPSLHAATARLTEAEAVADYQAAEMLPLINANADFHHRRFSATDFYGPNGGKSFTGAYIDPVVFRYHLDLWGKDKASLEAALGKERTQEAELAITQLVLSTAIARSYIELSSVEEDIELMHTLNEKTQEKLQLVQLRFQSGLSNQDAIHSNQQTVEASQQRETSLRSLAQLLRNRLATLAGQQLDWGKTIHADETHAVALLPKPDALSLGLLAHRPDVVAALWRVESAAQSIKVAKTNYYPDVNLVGFAGLRSLNLKDLFISHGASLAYGMGPNITLPIFEGGRLDAELKSQQGVYDAAVETYNGTLLTAVQQVADNLVQWQQTVEHDAEQTRALAAAHDAFTLEDKRFQAGLSPRDGVIDAELAVLQQQLTTSKLHNEHLLAAVGLIEALGGGYENKTPIKRSP